MAEFTHCAHSAYREEGVSESRVINIMLSVADADERKSYIFFLMTVSVILGQ